MRPYEIERYARKKFPGVPQRKERLHRAENHLIQSFFGAACRGVFVEVGAWDPVRASQTWHLERHGWTGVLIEPVPHLCEKLRRHRPGSTVVEAACGAPEACGEADFFIKDGFSHSTLDPERLDLPSRVTDVIRVTVRTLDDILQSVGLSRIDFLSIDVEGLQLEVLKGLSLETYRPRLILVEDHLADLSTHRYLVDRGYRLVKRTRRNNWYVPFGRPFGLTSPLERLALWRKIWLGAPWRLARQRANALGRRKTI